MKSFFTIKSFLIVLMLSLISLFSTIIFILSINTNDVEFKNYTKPLNNCEGINYYIENGIMHLDMKYIGFGSYYCIKDGLEQSRKVIIEDNFGGLIHESFLISKYIQKNNISVHIKNSCYSACTNILFSSKQSSIRDGARIATHQNNIHGYKILSPINHSIDRVKQYLILNNERDFDFDFYKNIINSTPYEDFYFYSNEELIKKGMISRISYLPKTS